MKCLFCQQECELNDDQPSWGEFYTCSNHKYKVGHRARYYSHKKGDCTPDCNCPSLVHYETEIYYKDYSCIYYIEENRFKICIRKTPRIIVLALPFIPDITPENIEQKVPIYITFS